MKPSYEGVRVLSPEDKALNPATPNRHYCSMAEC